MKRYFLIVFIFVINSIILFSCAFLQQSNNTVCVSCIDSDNDTKCDVCQKYVPPKAEEHTACSDSDSDGKCDVCGKKISENIHSDCTDSDSDGKCDVCGKSISEDTHTECTDSDGDGKCDECSEPIPDTPLLTLIEDGEIKFSLVTADGLSGNVHMELDSLSEKLARFGYSLEKYSDKSDNAVDKIEVLVGTVNSRGEKYRIDGWDYGFRGYAVKVIDSKVIIVAGNEVALNLAIRYFSEEVLGLTEDTEKLRDAVFFKSKETEYYQEYQISSLSIGGRDLDGYVIAYDTGDSVAASLARSIRETVFKYSGYNLKLANAEDVSDKYISIAHTERTGGEGFYVNINGQNIEIVSEYECKTLSVGTAYFLKLASAIGDFSFFSYTANTRDITYEENGAVGDGETNDIEAIRATHEHANSCRHTVVAKNGAEYYITPGVREVVIKSDVSWGKAKFIIDDRDIIPGSDESKLNFFRISTEAKVTTFTPENCEVIRSINAAGGIDASTVKKLDLGLGYPAMLEVYNANHKVYIRTHLVNEGNEQRELIIVDGEGNIDERTPFLLDYSEVTSIVARSLDDEPITVDGGIFITRAPDLERNYQEYMSRGIVINRSNTTVKNLVHQITDEGEVGCPYAGFLNIWRSDSVTVENCSFMSHKTYQVINSNCVRTNMGSYDIALQGSNNILFKGCTQPNFFDTDGETPYFAPERWGIMGSNYSKNIRYEDCRLSRLDAHCGVYNASLKNCEVVYISVVGGGTLTVEDTTVYNDQVIQLRGDYGSSWKGDIVVKNVFLKNINAPAFFNASWTNHDYGYQTYLPKNIIIDNFEIYEGNSITFFTDSFINAGDIGKDIYMGEKNENPMISIECIVIKNNNENIEFLLHDTEFFKDTEMIFE